MKKLSKIFALALAVLMLFALTATAFAADEPAADGSITISNATVDETYNIYKIFDLTFDGDNVAYTYTKTGETDNVFAALTATGSPFILTKGIEDCYNVTLAEGKSAADVSKWIKENLIDTKLISATDSEKATSETVTFSGLEYGYYYITSTLGAVATIDSTLKDVTVIDKNQIPSWDNEDGGDDDDPTPGKVIVVDGKKVTENTVNVGDVVDFDIGINAVNYIGAAEVTFYYVSDEIEDTFEYVTDEDGNLIVTVTVGDKTLTTDDYTLTMGEDGKSFEICIDWAEINADGELAPIYDANTVIHVTYQAILTEEANIAAPGNINTANFTYKTWPADPDNPPEIPDDPEDPDHPDNPDDPEPYDDENEKTTTTYTFALGFTKIDGATKEGIGGASFSIKDASGNTVYAKATDVPGVYMFCASDDEDALDIFATDGNGVLVIEGVKEGTYEVTEEAAPAGYNMLTAPVSVEAVLEKVDTYTVTYTTYYDAQGNIVDEAVTGGKTLTTEYPVNAVELVIENNAGTELPATGGIGTYIFYIGGAVLLLGAAILLVVKKRMNVEE